MTKVSILSFVVFTALTAPDCASARMVQAPDSYQGGNYDSYEFKACKKYEGQPENESFAESTLLCSEDGQKTLGQGSSVGEGIILEHFFDRLKANLEKKLADNSQRAKEAASCASGGSSPRCSKILADAREVVRSRLPYMRQTLALTNPSKLAIMGFRKFNAENNIDTTIKHPAFGAALEPLTEVERKAAESIFDSTNTRVQQQWLEDKSNTNNCVKMNATTNSYEFVSPECQGTFGPAIHNGLLAAFGNNVRQLKKDYFGMIEQAPYLAYIGSSRDFAQASDGEVNQVIGAAFTSLQKDIDKKKAEISGMTRRNLSSLLNYQAPIDEVLASIPNLQRPYCDIIQKIVKQNRRQDLAIDIGIGLSVFAGAGLCAATLGAGCGATAMAVAIAASTVAADATSIYRSQGKVDEQSERVAAGVGSEGALKDSLDNLDMTYGFAAASIGAEAAGPVVRSAMIARRAGLAEGGKLEALWMGRLSRQGKAAVAERLGADPALSTGYNSIQSMVRQAAARKSTDFPPGLQDGLMKNLNQSISLLGPGEKLNTQMIEASVRALTSAKAGTPEYVTALREVGLHNAILREANSAKGKTTYHKVKNYFDRLAVNSKISREQAEQAKSCMVGSSSAEYHMLKESMLCWNSPQRGKFL